MQPEPTKEWAIAKKAIKGESRPAFETNRLTMVDLDSFHAPIAVRFSGLPRAAGSSRRSTDIGRRSPHSARWMLGMTADLPVAAKRII
jgi:hypothetical protein